MKGKFLLSMMLLAAIFLTSCAGASSANATTMVEYSSSNIRTNYSNPMPVVSQLGLGIIKLDGSGKDLDKSQASTLLTLWKTLRVLNASSTSSVDEVNATIRQIEKSMSADQMKAISEMKLTAEDKSIVFANSKVGASSAGTTNTASKTQSQTSSGGGIPGGPGGPLDGGLGGLGMGSTPVQTPSSTSGAKIASNSYGIDQQVVDAVIVYLKRL